MSYEYRIVQVSPDGQHQPTSFRSDDRQEFQRKLEEFELLERRQRTGWTLYAERREVGAWEPVS